MHVGSRVRGTSIYSIQYVQAYTYRPYSARESYYAPVDIHFPFTCMLNAPQKYNNVNDFW